MTLSPNFILAPEITQALRLHQPVVALESAVITHGLPRPDNYQLATDLEAEVRHHGALPATTAILDGKVRVGMAPEQIKRLSKEDGLHKISSRDFGIAIAGQKSGGTTVAGSLVIARTVGIKVFATGGIGGIHRGAIHDVSADLQELSRSPVIVVCAGAKAILDLPATIEYLETMGVPIIGYQTDEFPAFYSRESGLKVDATVDSPADVVKIARSQWEIGLEKAVLVVVPPPPEIAIPAGEIEATIQVAVHEAEEQKVKGAAVTPFLLNRVSELTHGASLKTNLALLKNNVRVASELAKAIDKIQTREI
ncbi:MAG TPA: pseudouridine-5'-phosphate glycosidase [Longilinea sp.]|nr:pseudouridine-5'-phosphate glycosidase [Longilinea sp.]